MIVTLLATLALLAPGGIAVDDAVERPPNVLLILIDDMGCRDLSGEGHLKHRTPNIDRLARESVRFRQAYTNAPNCAPSRASIVTGRYTPRHGIHTVGSPRRGKPEDRRVEPPENRTVLADEEITIAEVLAEDGYRTDFIGKWHLGEDPTTQGFQRNVAGGQRGHPRSYFAPYRNEDITDGPDGEYLVDRLAQEVVKAMHASETSDDTPWFIMWCPYAVHTPIQAPDADVVAFKERFKDASNREAKYAGLVQRTDGAVGKVLEALEANGEAANTIVILLSDNGGHGRMTSHAPWRGSKGMLYEGGVRTPLYIRMPLATPADINTPVLAHDLFPTIIECAGADTAAHHDGVSLAGALRGESFQRGPLYWHFPAYLEAYNRTSEAEAREPDRPFRTTPVGALRDGRWKLLEYFEDGGLELYDLEEDPAERHNLAESHPDRARKMRESLNAWRSSVGAGMPTPLSDE